jgi:hypothetical protein
MPNLLPTLFIALCSLALLLALLWLWQSLRDVLVQTGTIAPPREAISPERAALLAEKQSVLLALKDLETEHEAGKLSDADFAQLNAQYRGRARNVLRELDALLGPHRGAARALLKTAAEGGKTEATAAANSSKPEREQKACSCGTGNDPDAVFCKKCGTRLSGVPA